MMQIYLDYNASTPIDPAVAAAMRPFLGEAFGNPSSGYWASRPAKAALENARGQVAELLGCAPDEIVFTSGGSEANNLALKGTFFALRDKGDHIITSVAEHPAILAPCRFLERLGAKVTLSTGSGRGILWLQRDSRKCARVARRALPWHIANSTGTERRRSPKRTAGAEAPSSRGGTSRKLWEAKLR